MIRTVQNHFGPIEGQGISVSLFRINGKVKRFILAAEILTLEYLLKDTLGDAGEIFNNVHISGCHY